MRSDNFQSLDVSTLYSLREEGVNEILSRPVRDPRAKFETTEIDAANDANPDSDPVVHRCIHGNGDKKGTKIGASSATAGTKKKPTPDLNISQT